MERYHHWFLKRLDQCKQLDECSDDDVLVMELQKTIRIFEASVLSLFFDKENVKSQQELRAHVAKQSAMVESRFDNCVLKAWEWRQFPTEQLWKIIEDVQQKCSHDEGCLPGPQPKTEEYLNPDFRYSSSLQFHTRYSLSHQLPLRENITQLQAICQQKKVLEIGAGMGLWARLLSDAFVDIVATDSWDWQWPDFGYWPVAKLDWLEAIRQHSDCQVLLMIWPPSNPPASLFEAIDEFQGTDIVLIGEAGGVTGGEALFHKLEAEYLAFWREECPGIVRSYHYYKCYMPKLGGLSAAGIYHWQK